ncbi:hypothetical protein B0J12DRAFT_37976 [Macrophomina phaseolina]|uniref:G-patch domain-containing protein n=1 Tax=Macrophomina phaseolina TaxID=35725 RepID=A0ABQ8GW66_9PEZI|nr:hypothetical protein B0J12DRAFT_37976 [Macrophomina phaseolina]
MDASALLAKQGWRGAGHGLGSTGHGIARPLLISNKQDALGVGKKKIQVADQWWMRAYDNGLKELGTGKQTALSSIRQNGMSKGGLYGFFVRGEGLAGTISDTSVGTSSSTSSPSDRSTPATTPEAESTAESKRFEKKRKREGEKEASWKKKKETSVARSKGKDKTARNTDSPSKQVSSKEAKPAATEDAKLLRRAAKKALRQKRAGLAAESRAPSDNNTTDEKSRSSADETSESKKGKKKRTGGGKGAVLWEEMEVATKSSSSDLSEKKLKKYAAKAAEKGISVEAYVAKKEGKKEKAKK